MTNLYNEFEKRFTDSWFSAGWIEVDKTKEPPLTNKKDLSELQLELRGLEDKLQDIELNKLRLSNLAKLYSE